MKKDFETISNGRNVLMFRKDHKAGVDTSRLIHF